jgi:hypothetical protein
MTPDDDLDRQIRAYLESGPAELADRVLWAARAQLKSTGRRRPGFARLAPWRNRHMTQNTRLWLIGASVLVIAIGAGLVGSIFARPNPGPAPLGSPAAEIDASAPANSVQAPPSSGDPAPSASAVLQPTPTPDPEAVRTAAAAQYLTAAQATTQAFEALQATDKAYYRGAAEIWGQFAADLEKLQVPPDTAADLRDLIRKVKKVQGLFVQASGHFARMDDFYIVARHLRNARSRASAAVDRVRSDLDLPALCRAGCPEPPPIG